MKLKKIFTGFVAAAVLATGTAYLTNENYVIYDAPVYAAEMLTTSSGLNESACVTWAPISGADGYNVYVKPQGGSYTQIDSMLIRQYNGYFRADAVGLKAGNYVMKVVPTTSGKEDTSKAIESSAITVNAYDRSGFAFSKNSPTGGNGIGAYNSDGTLKSNAMVIYVTESTKNNVKATINGTELTGIANITQQAKKCNVPICFRIIGQVTMDGLVSSDMSSAYALGVKEASNVTFEGIGDDATLYGAGLAAFTCNSIEMRNLGLMLWGGGKDGDGITLKKSVNVWVHNIDFFYGAAGSDADQVKGDGSMDLKDNSQYVTISYNHFWDSGKMSLCGMKSESGENWITYHHNWYDHSDSRHPRIRTMTVHSYNNYFDGNSKYGVGVTYGGNAFVENNYFRNCKYPMLISMQGSDIAEGTGTFSSENGGMIKSYGNYMEGQKAYVTYKENNTEFDAYEASSRDEKIPSSITAKQGGTSYNNFDTNSSIMYSYTPDKASDVPAIVMANAGRQNGGDFDFTFSSSEDADYSVNSNLMNALKSYKTSVIAIGSGFTNNDQPVVTTPAVTTTNQTTTSKTTTMVTVPIIPIETSVTVDISGGVIYCSPDGKSSSNGSIDNPMDVLTALSKVQPGGTIYMLKGIYKFDSTIKIDNSNNGTAGKYKTLAAYPGADVKWDFSAMATDPSNRGLVHDGNYWHLKGFEIAHAGDNGCLLSGSNNIFELMVFTDNQDTGLQISRYNTSDATIDTWPSNNKILNCTSKNNCDDATMENADGFAAKLTCGEGNVFDGCMAYNNSDDGWDLYAKTETGPIGVVTLRNCVAFRNGFTEYGEGFGGCDGNGFKLGGGGVGTAHVVENCLAFENLNCGFTDNNNPKLGSITNCTAYNNGMGGNGKPNFSCYRCTDDGCDFKNVITYINDSRLSASFPGGEAKAKTSNDKFVGTIENSIYYNSKYYFQSAKSDIANGGKIGENITPTDDMFVSLEVAPYTKVAAGSDSSYDFHAKWRNANGSVNTHGFLEIKDSTYSTIGAKFYEQSISVPTKGDVNADGIVNSADAVELQKFLVKKLTTVKNSYDINDDTKINIFDLVALKGILTK